MGSLKTAPVRWFLGQTVLPEHLQSLQETSLAVCEQRARLGGLPHYGVAQLTWSEPLLADGVLSITTLTVVLPSGDLAAIGQPK